MAKAAEDILGIVRQLFEQTDTSIKELTKRIDGFRDEYRDRLDKYKEDFELKIQTMKSNYDLKFEKASTELTVLKTEQKNYTRSWGTIIGVITSVITALLIFGLTRAIK